MGDSKLEVEPLTGKITLQTDAKTILNLINRLRSKLDRQSNIALRDLLTELKELYFMIDKSLSPFYGLNNDKIFQSKFGNSYSNFKATYNKDLSDLKYNCDTFKRKLDEVVNNHEWYTSRFQKFKIIFYTKK